MDKCKKLNFDGKMLSLDAESLFTKVTVDETIDFVKRKLPEWNINLPIDNDSFVKLIEIRVKDNVFTCKGEFYLQKYGMSMGSAPSPVLSNLFMEYIETELVPRISDIKWL